MSSSCLTSAWSWRAHGACGTLAFVCPTAGAVGAGAGAPTGCAPAAQARFVGQRRGGHRWRRRSVHLNSKSKACPRGRARRASQAEDVLGRCGGVGCRCPTGAWSCRRRVSKEALCCAPTRRRWRLGAWCASECGAAAHARFVRPRGRHPQVLRHHRYGCLPGR